MNTTQIRTSLKASNVTAKTKKAIEGVGAVLKGFKTYAENQSVNLSSPSAPASMKANIKGFQDALTSKITQDVAVSKFGNDTNGKVLYAEMQRIAAADINTINTRFANEINLYSESMMAGEYHPFQLAILPHVYLETLSQNSRFLMPTKEYVSEQLPPRKMLTRQVVIDGKKYDFPHCLKNPEVMRKLRSAGSEAFEYKLTDMTKKSFNIFTEANKGTKGESSLVPQLDIIKVKYADAGTGTDEEVEMKVSSVLPDANNYTMGKLYKEVKSTTTGANTTAIVAAEVNFATGDIKIVHSTEVKEVTFKVYMSGAYNRQSASIDIETKPIIQVIKNRINMIFDYDPGSMQNFLSLENIDGVLEGQSIIFDVVVSAKDQYAFDTLNGVLTDLKAMKAANFDFENSDSGCWSSTHYTKPGVANGFRPTSTEQWEIDELGRRIKEMHSVMATKFKSVSGMQFNWWASPINVQRFIRSTPIITKNESYGGLTNEYAVYGLQVAGQTCKMVETERAEDADGIKCVPYSNMESQPTFEFQQGPHALYTDGTFRNPSRPHMPAIAYYDYYDCNYVFAILGEIAISDTVAP